MFTKSSVIGLLKVAYPLHILLGVVIVTCAPDFSHAALGGQLRSFTPSIPGNGRAIAFDPVTGKLYYTLKGSTNIFLTDVNNSPAITINSAIRFGALSWDAKRGVLWAADYDQPGNVYQVTPQGVISFQFNFIPSGGNCYGQTPGFMDGLAYDEGPTLSDSDDTLWMSDDAGLQIHHVDLSGNVIASFPVPKDPRSGNQGCNGGIAVDGPFLWLALQSGPDDAPHDIVKVAKAAPAKVLASFPFSDTDIPGPEGLALDTVSVPGKPGIWSNEFGDTNSLKLWEINEGLFNFPLAGKASDDAEISSVFDHAVRTNNGSPLFYLNGRNGVVTAYTGEEGLQDCGLIGGCIDPSSARSTPSYKNRENTDFNVNGDYTGGRARCGRQKRDPCARWLSYDGHPGFDYPADLRTAIFAPADGIAFIPDCDPVTRQSDCNAVDDFNILAIDHGNGYSTWYLHLGHGDEDFRVIECPGENPIHLSRGDGQRIPVTTQCRIGEVGDKGVNSPHLHFEVRTGLIDFKCRRPGCVPIDPYGWTDPTRPDPYPKFPQLVIPNVRLWK